MSNVSSPTIEASSMIMASYDVLLVRRDGDVEEGVNGVCFEVRVEFFSVIGG